MDIENLQSSNNRSTASRPPDGFHAFLQTAFSALLAFVLSLRIIVFATARKRLTTTAANPDIQVEEASSSSSDTSSDTEVVEEGVFVQLIVTIFFESFRSFNYFVTLSLNLFEFPSTSLSSDFVFYLCISGSLYNSLPINLPSLLISHHIRSVMYDVPCIPKRQINTNRLSIKS
ncbi:hypothetical protein CRE_14811 [Caenorhabditis remanei]|uniref:Uncharacterized protein n=1 Tax=Caenorhabditis remanei TaxID=31234 RepID=E3MRU6_CAERE|nr:hypothetical protein CRE_14811 [Caenorhabditis remanei]